MLQTMADILAWFAVFFLSIFMCSASFYASRDRLGDVDPDKIWNGTPCLLAGVVTGMGYLFLSMMLNR